MNTDERETIIENLRNVYSLNYENEEERNKIVEKIIMQINKDEINDQLKTYEFVEFIKDDLLPHTFKTDDLPVFKFMRKYLVQLQDQESLALAIYNNNIKIIEYMCKKIHVNIYVKIINDLLFKEIEQLIHYTEENDRELTMDKIKKGLEFWINCLLNVIKSNKHFKQYKYHCIFSWMHGIDNQIVPYFNDTQRTNFYNFVKPFVTDEQFFKFIEKQPPDSIYRKWYEKDKIFQRPTTGTFMSMIASRHGKHISDPFNQFRKNYSIQGGKNKSRKSINRKKQTHKRKSINKIIKRSLNRKKRSLNK